MSANAPGQDLWSRVDEPILRWVAALPSTLAGDAIRYTVADAEFDEDVPGVTGADAEASFTRLLGAGLVTASDRGGTMGPARRDSLSNLRVTPAGLVLLGEWPDMERIATASGVHHLLRAVAEQAPDEQQTALRRAAGLVGRTMDGVVRDTLMQTAGAAGGDLADGA
ncbi:MAG: hypothetical protein QOJ13_953 [Gaiellales bacterium]|jgi:hypothetical protein|nr:hypothetical protein [Gaiellales bacterium]